MSVFRHMTYTDRLVIERLYNAGASYRKIAAEIGFSVSAVFTEVQRGLYNHLDGSTWTYVKRYSATIAQDDSDWKATAKGGDIKIGHNHAYAAEVSFRILAGESPDRIVGDKRRKSEWTVSTVTLYRYIANGFIPNVSNKNLLVKSRSKRIYSKTRAVHAPAGISIERRPSDVDSRSVFGHWEMDTVVGKSSGKDQILLVLTERKTRYEIICKLHDKTSSSVVRALSRIVPQFPQGTFLTLTCDNGPEFADYSSLKRFVREVYYCHPYSSFERGSNENANRLIRRFLPKGQSFHNVTQSDCDVIANYMNTMHRKILDYLTSTDLFSFELSRLQHSP